MSGFDTYFRAVRDRAELEAKEDGSATIEAQHLLLAIAAQNDTDVQRILEAAGIGYAGLKGALHREFEHNLSTAGVSLDAFDLPGATPDRGRHPQVAASFKLALERMASMYGGQQLQPGHLLLGILQAEVGTVPRVLALSGVDRNDLLKRVRNALDLQALPSDTSG